ACSIHIVLGLWFMVCFPIPIRADGPKKIDFAHDIIPLIKSHCSECHTNGKRKGSLALDTRESILKAKVVVPGKSADSELLKRIRPEHPNNPRRPRGSGSPPKDVGLSKAWADRVIPWQEGFSFLGAG